MNDRAQSLIDFHTATSFGNRGNLLLQQEQARSAYLGLTAEEQGELARHAIGEIERGNNLYDTKSMRPEETEFAKAMDKFVLSG